MDDLIFHRYQYPYTRTLKDGCTIAATYEIGGIVFTARIDKGGNVMKVREFHNQHPSECIDVHASSFWPFY